jgi:hypothetical protein
VRYVKGRADGRDRWTDSRVRGYAGRTEVCQGERSRPIPVVTIENIFQSPNIDSRTKKIIKCIKVEWQFDGQCPGFPPSTQSRPRVTSVDVSMKVNEKLVSFNFISFTLTELGYGERASFGSRRDR